MKKLIILFISLSTLCAVLIGQESNKNEIFSIYLVRHAEKIIDSENLKNPALTECGQKRAKDLAKFFGGIELKNIYSTNYTRTLDTAKPCADSKGLEVQLYDAGKLNDFAAHLRELKEDVLIVGHSNTTPVLAGILIGEKLSSIHDLVYNQVYQVVISSDGAKLNVFTTAMVCKN